METKVQLSGELDPLDSVISGKISLTPEGQEEKVFTFTVTDPLGINLHLRINYGECCVLELNSEPTKEILDQLTLGQKTLFFAILECLIAVCEQIEREYNSDAATKERYDKAAVCAELGGGKIRIRSEQGGMWTDSDEHIEAFLKMLAEATPLLNATS